jgi:hypothetical protein
MPEKKGKARSRKPQSRNAQPCATFRHYECGGECLSSEHRNAKMGKSKRSHRQHIAKPKASPKEAYEAISIANDIRPRRTNKRRQDRCMDASRKTLKTGEESRGNEKGISGGKLRYHEEQG